MNWNKQGQVGLPCSHRRHSHARSCLYSHRVHLCLVCSSSFGFEGHACLRVRDQKCVCALMSLSWRREETEGSGVMRTSTLGVCACACGDRERIEALVCIMERELSQLLGAFICLLQHQDTHARTHYFSWPTDLTRPAVICHLAAIWPVSAGLLSARGSMVIPPFEGRPIQSHG